MSYIYIYITKIWTVGGKRQSLQKKKKENSQWD